MVIVKKCTRLILVFVVVLLPWPWSNYDCFLICFSILYYAHNACTVHYVESYWLYMVVSAILFYCAYFYDHISLLI